MKNIDFLFETLLSLADNDSIDLNNINEQSSAVVILCKEHQILLAINKKVPKILFDTIKDFGYDIISDKKFNGLYIYSVINNPYKEIKVED